MTDTDSCDYCGTPVDTQQQFIMRAVGFTETPEGVTVPEVKLWCGDCITDGDGDPAAAAAVRRAAEHFGSYR